MTVALGWRDGRAGQGSGPDAGICRDLAAARYRVRSGRKADVFYTLEVDGPDVVCNCPGFEYRGQCRHARDVKAALASGQDVPAPYAEVR